MPLAVEVYEKLRTKIGQEEAALLVRFIEEAVEKRAATKEDVLEVKHALEQKITEVEHRLERRMDRTLYIMLAVLLILNGDRVLGFLNSLLGLFR